LAISADTHPRAEGPLAGVQREAVAVLQAVDSGSDADFERVVRLAARLFDASIGFIGVPDGDRLRHFARLGIEADDRPLAGSVCAHALETADLTHLVVEDASVDERFAANPLVAASSPVRFCAAAPILLRGQKVAVLCVGDRASRPGATPAQLSELSELAALAGTLFELKDEARVRARMAAELIKEEWRHALTLEAGKVGSWVWDLRTGEIVSNAIFRQMFGLQETSLHADQLFARIEPDDVDMVNAALRATFEDGVDYAVEFRVAATGRWLTGRGRVYQRDGAGKPLIVMGINIDVTEARESAEQTRLLLRELNHRVKNTLAMIQSLARQTLRQKPDPQQFIDSFSGRLRTLSEAHALLSDRDWSGIGLVELVRSQVAPYLLTSSGLFAMDGDDVTLPPDHALGLGLVLHELASNASKFGALSSPQGRVTVNWTIHPGPVRRLELLWEERHGPTVTTPKEAGFGTRLIERSLDKVLDSSVVLSFPPEGVEARIDMPID
jgi:PAS domain S-box-containing protein